MRDMDEFRNSALLRDMSDGFGSGDMDRVEVEVPEDPRSVLVTHSESIDYFVSYSLPTRLYTMFECRMHSSVCCSFLMSHSYQIQRVKTHDQAFERSLKLSLRRTSGTI